MSIEPAAMSTLATEVSMRLGEAIPMRDGLSLNAILYRPHGSEERLPTICAMTPYTVDNLHDRAIYFARAGYAFLAVDVRGRGASAGQFIPYVHEAVDAYDVVEWAASQPWSSGRVGMYGGSYLGYVQWAAIKGLPPHLRTIVPTAAPRPGIDVPIRANIAAPYYLRWLSAVAGRAGHMKVFGDVAYWNDAYRRWRASGESFRTFGNFAGLASDIFQDWLNHPFLDDYWDNLSPTADEYSQADLPILTITGAYDGDQPGAMAHYRAHVTGSGKAHYLIIGPWDHGGTAQPSDSVGGLPLGSASKVDMLDLHRQWYDWTLCNGQRPTFLEDKVRFYVTGAEEWANAPSLSQVADSEWKLLLEASGNPADPLQSGTLRTDETRFDGVIGHYDYNPLVVDLEDAASLSDADLVDASPVHALSWPKLVFHSDVQQRDVTIAGFPELDLLLAVNQPDADFRAWLYEIDGSGRSLLLSFDTLRARYREGPRQPVLITSDEPLSYRFRNFHFVGRRLSRGARLRLVIGPVVSLAEVGNRHSGKDPIDETAADSRAVTVRLHQRRAEPSVLRVPVRQLASDETTPGGIQRND